MADVTVTYTGPHDAVDLPLPSGRLVTVKRGESVDVPDEFAASLTQQAGNWAAQAETPKPPKTTKNKE